MEEKVEWLKQTGYKQHPDDGCYYFNYRKDDYRAGMILSLYEVVDAPLDYLKQKHEHFMGRVENREVF